MELPRHWSPSFELSEGSRGRSRRFHSVGARDCLADDTGVKRSSVASRAIIEEENPHGLTQEKYEAYDN